MALLNYLDVISRQNLLLEFLIWWNIEVFSTTLLLSRQRVDIGPRLWQSKLRLHTPILMLLRNSVQHPCPYP